MPPVAYWIARAQAVAFAALAIAVVVLAVTSTTSLAVGFVATEVAGCLLGAVLFGAAGRFRRVRTPILLLEVIAVGIAGQLISDGRPLIAVGVGLPALVVVVAILLGARADA